MSRQPSSDGPDGPGSERKRRKLGTVEWILLLALLGIAAYGLFFGGGSGSC